MPMPAYDLIALGATGFTGRQLVRALRRQAAGRGLRLALAGRRPAALAELAGADFDVLQADLLEPASIHALARQGRVLLNLAGPYAERGEAVLAACIGAGHHHLDLSGETFWMRQMVRQHHAIALRKQALAVNACGYEALPFELCAQGAAAALMNRCGERLAKLDVVVHFTGPTLTRLSDALSGGTLASMRMVLAHDRSDSLQRMDCLLPEPLPEGWSAKAASLANAAPLAPWWDAEAKSVMAPTLPAPFVNPPLLLRSAALAPDRFAPTFRYREGLALRGMAEGLLARFAGLLPAGEGPLARLGLAGLGGASLATQWSAAASLAAPLAAFSAASQSDTARQALQKLIERFGPQPGEGPSEAMLDAMGYRLDWRAAGERGARLSGSLHAQGHPGYRSTPEMMAAVGLALAEGRLGRGRAGVLGPGAAFGPEALPLLQPAGLNWTIHEAA